MRFAPLASVLPGLALLLGCAGPPEPAAVVEPQASRRAPATPAELPPYEALGSMISPDGTSWCILNVRLEERVSRASLRALWESLRKEQPSEWGRFTCRFHVHGDSWADVNEIGIIESPLPSESAEGAREDEAAAQAELVFEGDRCFLSIGDFEINMPRDRVAWVWGPEGPLAEVWYPDPTDGTWKIVRVAVAAGDAPLPPPRCGGAWLR